MFSILTVISISFIVGILFGPLLAFNQAVMAFLLFTLGVFLFLFRSEVKVRFFVLATVFLIAGFWRYHGIIPRNTDSFIRFYNGSNVAFSGVISEMPEETDSSQKVTVDDIILNNRRIQGKVFIKTRKFPKVAYGDTIQVDGALSEPPIFEDFLYRDYLAQSGIYSMMSYPKIEMTEKNGGNKMLTFLYGVRSRINEVVSKIMPEPQASLLSGILLGIKKGLPEDFSTNLKRSGVTHIIVISGANISFVLAFITKLAPIVGRKKATVLSLIGGALYVLMVGLTPPVLRAALMGFLTYIAILFGRQGDEIMALFFSAAVILCINPLLVSSVSFQLSFLATFGLIFLVPLFDRWFALLPTALREGLTVTLAAQILTMPILIYNFREFSLVAVMTNFLVLPTIPFITAFGVLTVVGGLTVLFIGRILGWFLWLVLTYFVCVVNFSGSLPFATLKLEKVNALYFLPYYLVIVALIVWSRTYGSVKKE